MLVRPEDVILDSAWCVKAGGWFLSSWTCLCLSGSLHGYILLCGSNQAELGLQADSSSGRFSFLASDLRSSAEMNHETPGSSHQPNQYISLWSYAFCTFLHVWPTNTSFIAWCTFRVTFWWASLGLSLLLWPRPSSSSFCTGWGKWDLPESSGFTGRREDGSNISGVATSPITNNLQVTWGKRKQQFKEFCSSFFHYSKINLKVSKQGLITVFGNSRFEINYRKINGPFLIFSWGIPA